MAPKSGLISSRGVQFRFTGAPALTKQFEILSSGIQRKVIKQGIADSLPVLAAAQRQQVRALGLVDSANLITSIRPGKVKKKKFRWFGSTLTGTRAQLRIDKSDKYYYPLVLEYGSKHISPKPFMRRGLDMVRFEIDRRFENFIRKEIKRRIKPISKKARVGLLAGTAVKA